MFMPNENQPNSARGVAWNLGDLYAGLDDPALDRDLQAALSRAQTFEQNYRGKIVTLSPDGAGTLLAAVQELESLSEQMDRPAIYAMLVHSAKTDVPQHGALVSKTREQRTVINKHLIFFDLEWIQLADVPAQAMIEHP